MTWLYSRINIPNLQDIRDELILAHTVMNDRNLGVRRSALYTNFFAVDLQPHVPKLAEFLHSHNLLHRLQRCMFVNADVNVPNRIHIDSTNQSVLYSLNIPLIDCAGTYTAFYEALDVVPSRNGSYLLAVDESTAVEIGRVECTLPVLVNTSIPHVGISDRPLRQMACIRFYPELTCDEVTRLVSATSLNL